MSVGQRGKQRLLPSTGIFVSAVQIFRWWQWVVRVVLLALSASQGCIAGVIGADLSLW